MGGPGGLPSAAMWRLLAGAALLGAGIAALVLAHDHRPEPRFPMHPLARGEHVLGVLNLYSTRSAWSQTACDAVRAGGIALVVLGAALLIFTLVRLAREA